MTKNNLLIDEKYSQKIEDLIENLKTASFCGLGNGAGQAFKSLWQKKYKIWQ
jgi:NADH:ubiquinone oxidoreductase subunit F (NADH-binding)